MVRNQWKEHLWKHLDQHQKCSSARCKKATAVLTWHLLSLGHCLHLVLHECRTSCDHSGATHGMVVFFGFKGKPSETISSTSTVKRSTSAAEIKIFGWIHSGDLPENPVHNRHRNYHKAVSRDPVGLHLETWAWWMCSKDLNLPFENIANSYINKSWFTHGLQRLQGITQPNKEQVQRDMTEEAAQKRTERRVFFSMWTWWKSPMLGGCHLKMLCGFGAALVFNKNHVDKYF